MTQQYGMPALRGLFHARSTVNRKERAMGIEAVTETGMPVNFTATGSLKGAGKLLGVACSVGGTTLTVATKTAAGTAVNLMNGVTLEAGRFYPLPFEFFGDCTFTLGGAADITVAWRRA